MVQSEMFGMRGLGILVGVVGLLSVATPARAMVSPEWNGLAIRARTARARGDLVRAEEIYRRLLGEAERLHRRDPRLTLAHTGLGEVLLAAGEPAEALPHLRTALELTREALGSRHRHVARAQRLLARALHASGDATTAAALLEESNALHREAREVATTGLAEGLEQLAQLRIDAGQPAAAEELMTEMRALSDAAPGEDDVAGSALPLAGPGSARDQVEAARVLEEQAKLAYRKGDPVAALEALRGSVDLREKALGLAHPWVGKGYVQLARLVRRVARSANAGQAD